MNTQANESRYLPLLIGGIAVILFSTAAIARIIGWIPASIGGFGNILAIAVFPVASAKAVPEPVDMDLPQAPGNARGKRRCAECGVIVSTQEIHASDEGDGPRSSGRSVARSPNELRVASARRYETIIRLADRSSRMINHASPASWRPGERVIVIDGANPSNR